MYMSPKQEDWQNEGDTKALRKPRHRMLQLLLSTLLFIGAACAIYIAFWCPVTESLKFFGSCSVLEEMPVTPHASSTDTDVSDSNRGGDRSDVDGYDDASSSFETGSDITIGEGGTGGGENNNENESGPRTTTIVNNIYQTFDTDTNTNTEVGEGGGNGNDDSDSVSMTFIRKQVDRIYEYVNNRFEEIAEEFTTQVLNVTENINIGGSVTDSSNSTGDLGDVLVSTVTGVQWVATSSLGFTATGGVADPAGDDMEVQFNNNGVFGASSNFLYDYNSNHLGIGTNNLDAVLNIQAASSVNYYPDPGENLLSNSSFDTDANGWDLFCGEWASGMVTITAECEENWGSVSTTFTAEASRVYQATFTLSGVENDTVSFGAYNDEEGVVDISEGFGNGTHTVNFTTNYDGEYTIELGLWDNFEGGTFSVENVEVQEVGESIPSGSSLLVARGDAGNELMRLTNEGRLGLGYDSPIARLHVRGGDEGYATGNFGTVASNEFGEFAPDGWEFGDCAVWNWGNVEVTYSSCAEPSFSIPILVEAEGTYELRFTLADVVNDEVVVEVSGAGEWDAESSSFDNGEHVITFTSSNSGTENLSFSLLNFNDGATFVLSSVYVEQKGRMRSEATIFVENGAGESMLWLGDDECDVVSIGRSAGSVCDSNFIGTFAGLNGGGPRVNFLGNYAGVGSDNVSGAVFVGHEAGYGSSEYQDSVFIGNRAGYGDIWNGQDNLCGECNEYPGRSILIGAYTSTGGHINSIALGYGTTNSASSQFLVGNISEAVFGDDGDGPFFYTSAEGTAIGETAPIVSGLTLSGNSIIHTSETLSDDVYGGYDLYDEDVIPAFFLDDAQDIAVKGDYAFVANGSEGISVIDVSTRHDPQPYDTFSSAGSAEGITISGDYAYVAADTAGLQVLDISSGVSLTGSYDTDGIATDVHVAGTYAYVADGDEGLQIIDISNPAVPVFLGEFDTAGTAQGVSVFGVYAYVADGADGLQIIDVSDPVTPTFLGTFDTAGDAQDVQVVGRYAYVADGDEGLQIIDISNPAVPVFVGSAAYGAARAVAVSGKYAYVAGDGWRVFDISDPSSPGVDGSGWWPNARGIFIAEDAYVYVAYESDLTHSGLYIGNLSSISTPSVYAEAVEARTLNVLTDAVVGGDIYMHSFKAAATSSVLGFVGIGTTTPSAQLTTTDTVRFVALGSVGGSLITDVLGNVTVSSDENLKDIAGDFARGLDAVLAITPIQYHWKEETGYDTATLYTGFSAQDVQGAIPEAVATDSRGYLTLADRPILATVVNAIKELWEKLIGQERRIDELENRIRTLESQQGIQYQPQEPEEPEQAVPTEPPVEELLPEPPVETPVEPPLETPVVPPQEPEVVVPPAPTPEQLPAV